MIGEDIPDLLVFKPKFMPDPDSLKYDIVSISSKTTKDGLYQGHCKCENDKPHGDGSMTYFESSDFSKFEGKWYNGKFDEGTLTYKNGDSYKGLFREGKRFIGALTFANGGDILESKETRS
jgi:hypothetical protein